MNERIVKIRERLAQKLPSQRFEHTLGVSYTSAALAMCYGEGIEKAELAGLLHDCGKYTNVTKQIEKCKKYGVILSIDDYDSPAVIHAPFGRYLAEYKYGIYDSDILNAIQYHTLGRPEMTPLEMIVYIADYIEPRRMQIPDLDELRKLAFQSLDDCVYLIAKRSIEYLKSKDLVIHPGSIETYNYYKKRYKEKHSDEFQ